MKTFFFRIQRFFWFFFKKIWAIKVQTTFLRSKYLFHLNLKCFLQKKWKNFEFEKRTFSRKKINTYHSTANLPFLPILITQVFFRKNPPFFYFFSKKSYSFSRILRHTCYNWVLKKFQVHYCPPVYLHRQLASKPWKTHRVEWMIFLPCYKFGRKILIIGLRTIKVSCSLQKLTLFKDWLLKHSQPKLKRQ